VITSGTLMLTMIAPGQTGTERIVPGPELATMPRVGSEVAAIALAERGVRTSIVRLSPTVHASGDRGFVPRLIDIARSTGGAAYVGDGSNRWPAVHRLDVAPLFRLAVEDAPAGSVLHGAAESGVPFRDIAEAIGRQLNVPAVSITAEDAGPRLGFLAAFAGLDNPTSSAITRELVHWTPTHPGLIADLEQGHYFKPEAGSMYQD
jgi:nucleoside-diphosphate-sugar epimerase